MYVFEVDRIGCIFRVGLWVFGNLYKCVSWEFLGDNDLVSFLGRIWCKIVFNFFFFCRRGWKCLGGWFWVFGWFGLIDVNFDVLVIDVWCKRCRYFFLFIIMVLDFLLGFVIIMLFCFFRRLSVLIRVLGGLGFFFWI